MSLIYASASSLNNNVDRWSDLVSYSVPAVPPRTAKTVNNVGPVTSESSGFGTPPISGQNALYFQGLGYRLGLTSATGSWGASSANSTDGGANGKLNFTNLGQYTVECFIRFNGSGGTGTQAWYEAGSSGLAAGTTGSAIYNAQSQVSFGSTFNTALSKGVWYHIALTRFNDGVNNIIQCWLDGTQIGAGSSNNTNWTGTDPFGTAVTPYIGGGNGSSGFGLDGYIQEYRISNIRRYTANFTPTTVPFVSDTNTLLLIHGSSPIVDDNT
jgi:hypothetical protein